MPLSYALSITHFFSSVGADAGFAAIVGLAILILLYFSHAREASTLRNELEAAMRRIEELERRLTGGTSPSAGARQPKDAAGASSAPEPPARASAGAGTSAPGGAAPARPPDSAPAGPGSAAPPGARAATPATAPRPAAGRRPTVVPAVAARPLTAPEGVAPTGVAAPAPSSGNPAALSGDGTAAAGGSPSSSGAAAAVAGDGLGATPPPVTAAAGGNGFSAARATSGLAGPARSLLEHGIPGQRPSLGWVLPAAVAAAIAVIAVVLVLVLSSGGSHQNSAALHRRHAASIAAVPAGVVPSSVTVAVVNATSINQLAHHVANVLTNQRFKEGTLATGTTQSQATSTIGYLPGHRNDALAVAHALKLPASVVAPVKQSSEGLVCPNASSCTDDVIVVAGSNLAPKR